MQQSHTRYSLRISDIAEKLGISYKQAYSLAVKNLDCRQLCRGGEILIDPASFWAFMEQDHRPGTKNWD